MTLNEKSILDDDTITSHVTTDSSSGRSKRTQVTNSRPLHGASLVGSTVLTSYGHGLVQECRQEEDGGCVYVIQLLTTTKQEGTDNHPPNSPHTSSQSLGILYTRELPVRIKTPTEEAQELNIACEAHEQMRRMNLELLFHEQGITDVVDHNQCITCLLSGKSATERHRFPHLHRMVDTACEKAVSATVAVQKVSTSKRHFPRLKKRLKKSETTPVSNDQEVQASENHEQQQQQQQTKSSRTTSDPSPPTMSLSTMLHPLRDNRLQFSAKPCLICGNPVCSEHSSTSFRKEGMTLCLGCERLFELDFIVECVSTADATERAKKIDHMVDCYDRCLLLLKYATQYADPIAQSLQQQKHQQNKIGLGSSGVGALSGMLGLAAAATILTPVGPPLLIASLFFGGGATVVQTGTEAFHYFSEPNLLADRIIALHGMTLSILRVTSTLRDAMMRDHIRTDALETNNTSSIKVSVQEALVNNRTGVVAVSNVGRAATLGSVAGAETAAGIGARGATALSRASAAAARTVRFARFAGGALSAAVLVMEANAIKGTLKEIHSGSPCDKANRIRAIKEEIRSGDLPSTAELDEECQAYLSALASRRIPEVAAVPVTAQAYEQYSEAVCSRVVPMSVIQDDYDRFEGSLVLREDDTLVIPQAIPTAPDPIPQNQPSFLGTMGSTLLRRIQLHQSQDNSTRLDDAFMEAPTMRGIQLRESDLDLLL